MKKIKDDNTLRYRVNNIPEGFYSHFNISENGMQSIYMPYMVDDEIFTYKRRNFISRLFGSIKNFFLRNK